MFYAALIADPASKPFRVLPDPILYPEYYLVISKVCAFPILVHPVQGLLCTFSAHVQTNTTSTMLY